MAAPRDAMMESLFGADLEDSDNDSRGTPRRDDADEAPPQEQVNVDIEEETREFEDDVDVERNERDDEDGAFSDARVGLKVRRSEAEYSDDEDDIVHPNQQQSRKTETGTAEAEAVSPPVLQRDTERALFGDSDSDSEKDDGEAPGRVRRADLSERRPAGIDEMEERWEDEEEEVRGDKWTDSLSGRDRERGRRDRGEEAWEEREHGGEEEVEGEGEAEAEVDGRNSALGEARLRTGVGAGWSESGKAGGGRQGSGPQLDLRLDLLPSPAAGNGKMSLVLASNIVGIETRPFIPSSFSPDRHGNHGSSSSQGDAGSAAAHPQTLIRWRRRRNDDGSYSLESNARLVRWSDGSMHLLVGSDVLTADMKSMKNDKAHLFVRHPHQGVVQAQGRLGEKMRFRPSDTRSNIHKKLTLGLDSKYKRTTHIKSVVTTVDPEKEKEEKEKSLERVIREKELLKQRQEASARKFSLKAGAHPLPHRDRERERERERDLIPSRSRHEGVGGRGRNRDEEEDEGYDEENDEDEYEEEEEDDADAVEENEDEEEEAEDYSDEGEADRGEARTQGGKRHGGEMVPKKISKVARMSHHRQEEGYDSPIEDGRDKDRGHLEDREESKKPLAVRRKRVVESDDEDE